MPETLSPEARNLIERTIEWFTPKTRWTKNAWGVIKGKDGEVLEVEDEYLLYDRAWRDHEVEQEIYNDKNPWSDYEYIQPFKDVKEVDNACLVGGLIVNNNYQDDAVFEEAKTFLANLVDKTKENERDYYYDPQDVLVSFNDNATTDKRKVMNLLRRAVRR